MTTVIDALPEEVKPVFREVTDLRNTYRKRARQNRIWFRFTGVAVIVLSTSLPLMTIPDYGAKKVLISAVGVTIALLTGLRNFYQWDQLWSLLRQSDFELTYLLAKGELDVAGAPRDPERPAKLLEIAAKLRDEAEQVRRSESTRYFGSLRFPSTSGG
jgi:Protein of unknown function (DUF4231)